MFAEIVGTFAGTLLISAVPDPPVVPLQLPKVFQSELTAPFQVAADMAPGPNRAEPANNLANQTPLLRTVAAREARVLKFQVFILISQSWRVPFRISTVAHLTMDAGNPEWIPRRGFGLGLRS